MPIEKRSDSPLAGLWQNDAREPWWLIRDPERRELDVAAGDR